MIAKKKRRFPKKPLPCQIKSENLLINITDNQIVTDAGWEKITFEQASNFFKPEEVKDWYASFWSGADISNLLVELDVNVDLDDEEAVDKFLESYDWTPKEVNLVVAKAIYENYAWARVLTISTPDIEEYYFQNYEMEAILLGIHMRNYFNLNVPVINDCKDAVRYLYGKYPNVGWQPRKCVASAHCLKISQATKVYDEQSWEAEWEENYLEED